MRIRLFKIVCVKEYNVDRDGDWVATSPQTPIAVRGTTEREASAKMLEHFAYSVEHEQEEKP